MVPVAHAGGIDELLFTLIPVVVFVAVFRLAPGRPQGPPDARAHHEDEQGVSPR